MWVKPSGPSNMIIAVERLVREQYQHRNLHAEYLENGEVTEVVEFDDMSSDEVTS